METIVAALVAAALTMGLPSGEIPSDATERERAEPLTQDVRTTWAEEAIIPVSIVEMVEEAQEPEPEYTYIGNFYVTGYDACAKCCGKSDAITASGVKAEVGRTVAMCSDYPFGTEIYIDGLGTYTVEDRGVGRGCVDVFCNNHSECYKITGHYECYLVEDGE